MKEVETKSFLKITWEMLSLPARIAIFSLMSLAIIPVWYLSLMQTGHKPNASFFVNAHYIQTGIVLIIVTIMFIWDYRLEKTRIFRDIFLKGSA